MPAFIVISLLPTPGVLAGSVFSGLDRAAEFDMRLKDAGTNHVRRREASEPRWRSSPRNFPQH
jgi:hypothetical protein